MNDKSDNDPMPDVSNSDNRYTVLYYLYCKGLINTKRFYDIAILQNFPLILLIGNFLSQRSPMI